jgi:hypothetical protein
MICSLAMLRTLCKLVTFFLVPIPLWAQSVHEPLNSDRPDQSEGPYVLPKGIIQVESGTLLGVWEGIELLQNTMVRYGINGSTEVRLLFDAGHDGTEWGIQPLGFSVKQKLANAKGLWPDVALVAYVFAHPKPNVEQPSAIVSSVLVVAAENAIGEKVSVCYTAGGAFSDAEFLPTTILTAQTMYRPVNRIGLFVEYFGQFGTETSNGADVGLMFHPTPNVMLDVAGGAMHDSQGWDGYLTMGLCLRFMPCSTSIATN